MDGNARKRRSALQSIERRVRQELDASRPCALLLVNIDRLRQLNLSHGYRLVDALLAEQEQRLQALVEGRGQVERIGNADYLVLLTGMLNEGHAQLAANRIRARLSELVELPQGDFYMNLAIGILLPQAGEHLEQWLRDLEKALLLARQKADGWSLPDTASSSPEVIDWDIENDLQKAIERDQFSMHYQPQRS